MAGITTPSAAASVSSPSTVHKAHAPPSRASKRLKTDRPCVACCRMNSQKFSGGGGRQVERQFRAGPLWPFRAIVVCCRWSLPNGQITEIMLARHGREHGEHRSQQDRGPMADLSHAHQQDQNGPQSDPYQQGKNQERSEIRLCIDGHPSRRSAQTASSRAAKSPVRASEKARRRWA